MPRAPSTTSSDRKSTRLNSSHDQISYAVFCLKKKKTEMADGNTRNTSWTDFLSVYLQIGMRHPDQDERHSYLHATSISLRVVRIVRQRLTGVRRIVYCACVRTVMCEAMDFFTFACPLSDPHSSIFSGRDVTFRTLLFSSLSLMQRNVVFSFFFFNNPAPPEIYPLPLPDPLPISERPLPRHRQVLRPHHRVELGPRIDPEEGRPVPPPANRPRCPRHVGARIHAYGAAVAEP